MPKAANKTVQTRVSPKAFVATIEHPIRRADAETLIDWFQDVTGLAPKMWGDSIVGYGRYHYRYDSGREGDYMLTGFSPRKSATTIYVMPGYRFAQMPGRLARLGKHKLGRSCLYINKLSDIDMDVLREIVADGIAYMRAHYKTWDE